MKSPHRDSASPGGPSSVHRKPDAFVRFLQRVFGDGFVHSLQTSGWGSRLVGTPIDPLAIPEFSSLAQLKQASKSAPAQRHAHPARAPDTQRVYASALPEGSASASQEPIAAPAPEPAPDPDPTPEPEAVAAAEPAPLAANEEAPVTPLAVPPAAPHSDAASLVVAALRGAPRPDGSLAATAPASAAPASAAPASAAPASAALSRSMAAQDMAVAPEPGPEQEALPFEAEGGVPSALPADDAPTPDPVPQAEAVPALAVLAEGEETVFAEEPAPASHAGEHARNVMVMSGVAAVLLLAMFVRSPSDGPAPAVQASLPPAPAVSPTPTGLAAVLAIVNPQNVPAPVPVPTETLAESLAESRGESPAEAGLTSASGASSRPGLAGSALFPFAIEIVTPTPRAGEELLFSDPLVASAPEEAAAPVYTGPSSVEEPVILPAMAAEQNGGNAIPAASLEELARPRILPAVAVALIPDRATPTPTAAPLPTEAPIVLAPGRAWSTFAPAGDATHFWVGRPHPAFVANQIAAPSYQFGSTGGGRYRPHHGMDIANTFGTPVRAATTGEVVHAGLDDPDVLGPYPNFYGNAVVIRLDRRLTVAGGEMDVFLLYGHLSTVSVQKGQRVQPDDIVGTVGMTGIAIGPHLHVEMRVGANSYEASVNPYLWVEPPPGQGAVAVRLLTADGRTWPRARVTLARFEGNLATWARVMEIYPDNESVNPDPAFGENGAMDAVPEGVYYMVAVLNGERVAAEAVVRAGETTFVEMRTQQ